MVNLLRGPRCHWTARQVETAKPKDKIYKIADGGGLYLQVNPNGSKYWQMKYHYAGKEKKLSFGTYPTITLAEARKRRDEAKKIMPMVKDPGEVKAENLEKNLSEGEELLPQSPPSGTTQSFRLVCQLR